MKKTTARRRASSRSSVKQDDATDAIIEVLSLQYPEPGLSQHREYLKALEAAGGMLARVEFFPESNPLRRVQRAINRGLKADVESKRGKKTGGINSAKTRGGEDSLKVRIQEAAKKLKRANTPEEDWVSTITKNSEYKERYVRKVLANMRAERKP